MKNFMKQPAVIMAVNFATAMALYTIARLVFCCYNFMDVMQGSTSESFTRLLTGGLRFDLSALCYINILFVVMQTLPFRFRDTPLYQQIVKWLFIIFNTLGLLVNAADIVYFEFGGRRTTASFFSEFGHESNIGKILGESITQYWPVWIFGLLSVAALIFLYYNPIKERKHPSEYAPGAVYYPLHTILFLCITSITFIGLRGGWSLKMHPLRMDSAQLYIQESKYAPIVLNTPFTILTTLHKSGFKDPGFYSSGAQLTAVFDPVHKSADPHQSMERKNIVVILMEGFSTEYTGYYNHDLDGGQYKGYTPFLDSLISMSYHFRTSLANGIRSVDAMPGVFAGIPRYIEPYCYYVYANNTLDGLPEMLEKEGYRCAFYHGAPNTTLGFKMFTNSIGFREYYGMNEYNDPSQFDGTWAIFDEPYLQYFASQVNQIAAEGQPFLATVFTASSHQPYRVPDEYQDKFPEGPHRMHKAVGYSDYSLRRFFDAIKDKPWYSNTLFVVSADHTGPNSREEYNNEYGRFRIPIFFYTPDGSIPARCDSTRIMQQIDITPTLLGLLHYGGDYVSFGKNVFETDSAKYVNYAFNDLNGTSMYYLDTLMIQYSNNQLTGIYDYLRDSQLKNNLIDSKDRFSQLPFMESHMQAIIQQYIQRMKDDRLSIRNEQADKQ